MNQRTIRINLKVRTAGHSVIATCHEIPVFVSAKSLTELDHALAEVKEGITKYLDGMSDSEAKAYLDAQGVEYDATEESTPEDRVELAIC